jgi:hypothetical protein
VSDDAVVAAKRREECPRATAMACDYERSWQVWERASGSSGSGILAFTS